MALAMSVVDAAKALIGCTLRARGRRRRHRRDRGLPRDRGGRHAHIGMTPRSRVLFEAPGRLYVYRSYGIHALANIVVEPEGVGAAVLIRALEPIEGLETMAMRRGRTRPVDLCSGPGQADAGARHRARPQRHERARRSRPDRPAAARLGAAAARRRAADRHHEGSGPAVAVLRRGQHPRVAAVAAGDASSAPCASGQPRLVGEHDRLHAVAQPELREQPRDVRLDRRLLDDEQLARSPRSRGPARRAASTSSSRGVSSSSCGGRRGARRRPARDELVDAAGA